MRKLDPDRRFRALVGLQQGRRPSAIARELGCNTRTIQRLRNGPRESAELPDPDEEAAVSLAALETDAWARDDDFDDEADDDFDDEADDDFEDDLEDDADNAEPESEQVFGARESWVIAAIAFVAFVGVVIYIHYASGEG
jgi:hypothetical protein